MRSSTGQKHLNCLHDGTIGAIRHGEAQKGDGNLRREGCRSPFLRPFWTRKRRAHGETVGGHGRKNLRNLEVILEGNLEVDTEGNCVSFGRVSFVL